jgi:hypothetical protein
MASKHGEPHSRPWVNGFATRISDPVVRLRFLKVVAPVAEPAPQREWRRVLQVVLLVVLTGALGFSIFVVRATSRAENTPAPAARIERAGAPRADRPPEVWLVEKSANSEVYSNGLRIDNRFAVFNRARSYRAFPADGGRNEIRGSQPVGIVFHTTESRQAPFEERQNGVLKKIGESLLEYVQRKRAYNFLIDRFGRVYRIVAETDAANHAGNSVWSDGKWLYVNLNESFLGVSFEAETRPGQLEAAVSAAQLRTAAILTEMLRSRYGIAAENCVTHGQVSVNPSNMRVGYHTDWASSFPFERLGLPDNYARALPALSAFGFESDPAFLQAAGARMALSVNLADDSLQVHATAMGLSVRAYRKTLQTLYRERLAQVRSSNSESE